MRTARNLAFVVFTLLLAVASHQRLLAFGSMDSFGDRYNCDLYDWSPMEEAITGWCDCDGGMGCAGEEEFCSDLDSACAAECDGSYSTSCNPALVGYVECICDVD